MTDSFVTVVRSPGDPPSLSNYFHACVMKTYNRGSGLPHEEPAKIRKRFALGARDYNKFCHPLGPSPPITAVDVPNQRAMRLLCTLVALFPISASCFAVGPRFVPRKALAAADSTAAAARPAADAVRSNSPRKRHRHRWRATALSTDADDLGTEIMVEVKGGIQVKRCADCGVHVQDTEHAIIVLLNMKEGNPPR